MTREPIVPDPTAPSAIDQLKAWFATHPHRKPPADLMAAGCAQFREEQRRRDLPQVWALIRAGWTFELPAGPDPTLGSWYWRRPPKRPGRPGRFFASTNQAHNALMRERDQAPADLS
jgi:hypothetical protein